MSFHFFYGGFMSQWFPSNFTIDEHEFNCTEQYMMYRKALLFTDNDALGKIMSTNDPAKQKSIGRSIKNYSDMQWTAVARDVVFRGNMAKFSQNQKLKDLLVSTNPEELVEASPYDTRWGIGLGVNDPDRLDRDKWDGYNWLGKVLMEVRTCLIGGK